MATTHISEARSFAALVRNGATVERVRREIGRDTPYRRRVLLAFDALQPGLTPELKSVVVRLLRIHSVHTVHLKLGIPHEVIQKISKDAHAPWIKVGRGRRISPEVRAAVRAAVEKGLRSAEIERQFRVNYDTVQKVRNELGDVEDRRHWQKLSAAQVVQGAEMLRSGRRWKEVAAQLGCALATLQRAVSYRKNRQPLSPAQLSYATTKLQQGQSWDSVAAELGFGRQTLLNKIAWRKHRKFTAAETSKIRELFAAGKSNGEIAKQMQCSKSTILMRRRKGQPHGQT